jgi:branched-chain amino acid transport system permease protein
VKWVRHIAVPQRWLGSAIPSTATSWPRSYSRRSWPDSAGGLFAIGHRFASLDVLHWTTSGKAVIVVVLGGIGTLWGGVIGAALLVQLEDWLSYSGFEAVGLVTGVLFVAVVLLFRRGLWGTAAVLPKRIPRR